MSYTVKELAELLSGLPEEDQSKPVAIAFDSGVRMSVDVVTTFTADEWDDKFNSKTDLIVLTDSSENKENW